MRQRCKREMYERDVKKGCRQGKKQKNKKKTNGESDQTEIKERNVRKGYNEEVWARKKYKKNRKKTNGDRNIREKCTKGILQRGVGKKKTKKNRKKTNGDRNI